MASQALILILCFWPIRKEIVSSMYNNEHITVYSVRGHNNWLFTAVSVY